jgi:hypothetical protein
LSHRKTPPTNRHLFMLTARYWYRLEWNPHRKCSITCFTAHEFKIHLVQNSSDTSDRRRQPFLYLWNDNKFVKPSVIRFSDCGMRHFPYFLIRSESSHAAVMSPAHMKYLFMAILTYGCFRRQETFVCSNTSASPARGHCRFAIRRSVHIPRVFGRETNGSIEDTTDGLSSKLRNALQNASKYSSYALKE